MQSPGQGLVDFWVRPVDWAIELLCDGRGLAEHERRFLPGGRYNLWEFKQYALVDFRSEGGASPSKPRDTNCYHVLFESQYEFARCVDATNNMQQLWCVKLVGGTLTLAAACVIGVGHRVTCVIPNKPTDSVLDLTLPVVGR